MLETDIAASPDFGEIVTALKRFAPSKLDEIRNDHPAEDDAVFRSGQTMGGNENTPLLCTLALEMLGTYGSAAAGLTQKIRRRLGMSWWFDFVAKLLATSGAGGTVAAFLGGLPKDQGTIAGVVALFGSACGLLFSMLQRDAAGGSLPSAYNKLIESLVDAEQQRRALRALCPAGPSPELTAAINKADDLARTLNELALRYG